MRSLLLFLTAVHAVLGTAVGSPPKRRHPRNIKVTRASTVTAQRSPLGAGVALPSSANCTWETFEQVVDHFGRVSPTTATSTFSQRLCIYDGFVQDKTSPSVVLFYVGNESPVEEYVNNTGLMWELAPELDALLVWAEHRYEGESVPALVGMDDCMSFATIEQALADYAVIISSLQSRFTSTVPFVAVGGSYGGMLASWMRFKYPSSVVGAIAASAPIWGFPLTSPPLDGSYYAVSRGFSAAGGATDQCASNFLAAWPLLQWLGDTSEGREYLAENMRLCSALDTSSQVSEMISSIQGVFFDVAEGNYPFPSTYITSAVGPGQYPLPAWPMRVACEGLNEDLGISLTGDTEQVSFAVNIAQTTEAGVSAGLRSRSSALMSINVEWANYTVDNALSVSDLDSTGVPALLSGIADAWGVWCNVTGELECFDGVVGCATGASSVGSTRESSPRMEVKIQDDDTASSTTCTQSWSLGCWEPLCCNDNLNLVQYLVQGVGNDVFWPPNVDRNFSMESVIGPDGTLDAGCSAGLGRYGYPDAFDPWSHWLTTYFGGVEISSHSNIIFSNGLLDPWSGAGVYTDGVPPPGAYNGPVIQNITQDGSMQALILDLGAHHLDLMFMDDNDPECAYVAREVEKEAIKRWVSS